MENISGMVEVMERGIAEAPSVDRFESFEVCQASETCDDPDLAEFCAIAFVRLEVGDASRATAPDNPGRRSPGSKARKGKMHGASAARSP